LKSRKKEINSTWETARARVGLVFFLFARGRVSRIDLERMVWCRRGRFVMLLDQQALFFWSLLFFFSFFLSFSRASGPQQN